MNKTAIILSIILMVLFVEISFGQEAPSQEVQRRAAEMVYLELVRMEVNAELSHQIIWQANPDMGDFYDTWMWSVKITNNLPDTIKFCSIKIKFYNGAGNYIGYNLIENKERIPGHSSLTFMLKDDSVPYQAYSVKWKWSKIIIINSENQQMIVADYEKKQVSHKPYEEFMKIKKGKQEKQNEKSELFDPDSMKGVDRAAHVGSKTSVDDRSVGVEKIK